MPNALAKQYDLREPCAARNIAEREREGEREIFHDRRGVIARGGPG